jgi:hypothetical protein
MSQLIDEKTVLQLNLIVHQEIILVMEKNFVLIYHKENHMLLKDIITIQLTINDVLVVIIKILHHEHDDEKVIRLFDDLNKVDLRENKHQIDFIRMDFFLRGAEIRHDSRMS